MPRLDVHNWIFTAAENVSLGMTHHEHHRGVRKIVFLSSL